MTFWGVTASDEVIRLDIDEDALAVAKKRFPTCSLLCASGESLPFPDETYDRVISSVALPYMRIERALPEIYRILVPDGTLTISLHPPSFTLGELRHHAIPRPKATLFRCYVLANGAWFHCSGRTMRLMKKSESFQTERGMKIALKRAGFSYFSFSRPHGPKGKMFVVEARKPGSYGQVMHPEVADKKHTSSEVPANTVTR